VRRRAISFVPSFIRNTTLYIPLPDTSNLGAPKTSKMAQYPTQCETCLDPIISETNLWRHIAIHLVRAHEGPSRVLSDSVIVSNHFSSSDATQFSTAASTRAVHPEIPISNHFGSSATQFSTTSARTVHPELSISSKRSTA